MGIFVKGGEPNKMYKGGVPILAIYAKGVKIWPSIILSCYNNGYWIDLYPWTDETPWVD